jgi:hypothetical protein
VTTLEYYQPNEAEQRLIDALRSGEYEQGYFKLERDGCFCCLGVACRVSQCDLTIEYDGVMVRFNGEYASLPQIVQDELGWESDSGVLSFSHFEDSMHPRDFFDVYTLSYLNDRCFTFDQIADVIEAGLVRRKDELVAA